MKSKGTARMANTTWVVVIRFLLAFTLVVSLFPTLPLVAKAEEAVDEVQTTEVEEAETPVVEAPVAEIEEAGSSDKVMSPEVDEQEKLFKTSISGDSNSNGSDMSLTTMSNKAAPLYAASDVASGNLRGMDWSISTSGVLTLGNGTEQTLDCANYTLGTYSPFKNYANSITSVVVSGTVTAYGNLTNLFNGLTKVTSINLHNFNTSNVTNMSKMFYNCSRLTTLDVSNFNTSNVTDMNSMFQSCSRLTTLNVSSFNTSNVTSMVNMFNGCSGLTSLDVNNFDTSSVTSMANTFNSCRGLTTLDVSNFNTSNVTNMDNMFYNCPGLTSLDVSNFNTSNVTSMNSMFYACSKLATLNVSNFNTSSVTSMANTFNSCRGLTTLDVSNFNTSSVTNMNSVFANCSGLTSLDVSNLNTSNVTNMNSMFYGCSGLTSLDVSNFNTSNVTSMSSMFYGCSKLATLDVSNLNTSSVTNMTSMFYGCTGLTSLDVSNFNTSSVTSMNSMFNNCSGLTTLDVSDFNTSNVTNMSVMFASCSRLTSLDVSNFNTSSVTNMTSMFYGCFNLAVIYASSSFFTDAVTSSINMFNSCYKLTGGAGTTYDSSHIDKEYARIDSTDTPGYFTYRNPIQPREVTATPGENATFMLSNPSYTLGTLEISLNGIETANIPNAYWSLDGENWFSATRTDGVYTLGATSGTNGNGGAALFTNYGTYEIHWKVDATEDGYSESTGTFNFTIDPIIVSTITPTDKTYNGTMLYVTSSKPTSKYIFSGDYEAVMPGTYNCTVMPAVGYAWEDGTSNAVTLTWTINETSGEPINYWYVKDRVLHIEHGTFTSQTIGANDADEWPAESDNAGHPMCSNKFPTSAVSRTNTYSQASSLTAWDSCEIGTSLQESQAGIGPYAFNKCSNMQAISGLSNTYASGTSLTSMFNGCSSLKTLDLSGFDTTGVTTMSSMFYGCSNLTTLDLSSFDTSNVTNMNNMFQSCSSLTSLDVSNFNTSKVTNIGSAFRDCESLTSLDLSNFDTSSITSMIYMFYNCPSLTSLNISSFDTSKVTSFNNIFMGTYNLREITLGPSFAPNGNSITNTNVKFKLPGEYWYNMDMEPTILTNVDDLRDNWNGSTMAGTWVRQNSSTHELIDCSGTGYSNFRSRLSYISGGTNSTTSSNSYVKRVIFVSGGHEYEGLDLSNASLFEDLGTKEMYIDFSKAQDGSILARMTDDGTVYIYSEGQIVSGPNCKGMFYRFFNLTDVDMSEIEFKDVTTVEEMFDDCSSLESIMGISNLVGSSCTTTKWMFLGACDSYSNRTKDLYLDCGRWDTSGVTDMTSMFSHCNAIEDIDVSGWDVSNVESFSNMFTYAQGFEHLDCSKWDTSSAKNMYMMFYGTSLEELNLSNFNTMSLTSNPNSGMFFPNTMKKVVLGPNWTFGIGLSSDGTSYRNVFNPNSPSSDAPYSGTWEKVGEGIPYTPSEMAALKTPLNGYDYTGTWVWSGYEETQHGTYSVSFNANGGQGYVPDPIEATQGIYESVPQSSLSKPGYAFIGWNTQQDGSGAWAHNDGTFKDLASPNESVTLYAQWREDRWSISVPLAVKYNSKSAGAVSESFAADITVAGSFPGTVNVSGSSTGLVCDQTGRIPITCSSLAEPLAFSSEGTQSDSVSLNGMAKLGRYKGTIDYVTAHDKSQDYNLAYVLSGGTLSGDEPMAYKNADNVVLVSPTRDGYNFAGWVWDGQTTPVMSLPSGTVGDLQLTAVWTEA